MSRLTSLHAPAPITIQPGKTVLGFDTVRRPEVLAAGAMFFRGTQANPHAEAIGDARGAIRNSAGTSVADG
jgi:hypothetical protein